MEATIPPKIIYYCPSPEAVVIEETHDWWRCLATMNCEQSHAHCDRDCHDTGYPFPNFVVEGPLTVGHCQGHYDQRKSLTYPHSSPKNRGEL